MSKDSATWLEVGEEQAGQRVDNFLLRICKGVPKSHVYRILRSGEVRVNKGRIGPDYRLSQGDVLRLPPLRLAAGPEPVHIPKRDFCVVHEDEALLLIDKPAGLAVHGGSGVAFGVIEQLRRQRPEARFLELVHRLDRDTSGLLLLARKRSALTRLQDAFRAGTVKKRYLALVLGRWRNALQHVRLPLLKTLSSEGERRVYVSEEGKVAHSIVRLLGRWESFSLVEVELKTGRTHQIRVHLAHLGFPIAGDDKYGDFAANKALQKAGLGRMFLHARSLVLAHPATGEELVFSARLAPELRDFLLSLDDHERLDFGSRSELEAL